MPPGMRRCSYAVAAWALCIAASVCNGQAGFKAYNVLEAILKATATQAGIATSIGVGVRLAADDGVKTP